MEGEGDWGKMNASKLALPEEKNSSAVVLNLSPKIDSSQVH
jgi:hypothetical protein